MPERSAESEYTSGLNRYQIVLTKSNRALLARRKERHSAIERRVSSLLRLPQQVNPTSSAGLSDKSARLENRVFIVASGVRFACY